MGKSIFEKLGLVEKGDSASEALNLSKTLGLNDEIPFTTNNSKEIESDTTIPVETPNSENLVTIDEIYNSNNMADLTRSIYKVDEISKVLPETLSTSSKRESTIGMLKVSNINIKDALTDGLTRITVLKSVNDQILKEDKTNIEDAKTRIDELQNSIDSLKDKINNISKKSEDQVALIKTEEDKIDAIIDFLKPKEDKDLSAK